MNCFYAFALLVILISLIPLSIVKFRTFYLRLMVGPKNTQSFSEMYFRVNARKNQDFGLEAPLPLHPRFGLTWALTKNNVLQVGFSYPLMMFYFIFAIFHVRCATVSRLLRPIQRFQRPAQRRRWVWSGLAGLYAGIMSLI